MWLQVGENTINIFQELKIQSLIEGHLQDTSSLSINSKTKVMI